MSTGAKVTLFGCGGCATLLVVLFVAVGCLALVAPSSESRLDTAEQPAEVRSRTGWVTR